MENTKIKHLIKEYGGIIKLAKAMGVDRQTITAWKHQNEFIKKDFLTKALNKIGYTLDWFLSEDNFSQEWRVYQSDSRVSRKDLVKLHGFDAELPSEHFKKSGKYVYYQVIAK